ncbi:MAG: organic solvent ABC transporter substrate-binding protein [Myxococcales bacterium 68-20]|nr:MCE family protein [Myxococcales bacterium]OJY19807.1 MAG: organic solvent ABC transporter substrate-binding protein [Myxococcales bacterium 68-20]
MAQEKSIEVKVGILILVSLGILAAFVLVMGGLSFEKTYTVYVDFDNPGGLQSGAPVRVAGVKCGKVSELQFLGGKVDPKTNRRTLVRAKVALEQRVKESIHEDADFYVTTQGVLGEQFLAIDPGSSQKPVLAENTIVKGIDPPRLDLFLAKAYELLDTTINGIRNNRELISDIATNTAGLLKGLNTVLSDNRERIDRIVQNLEALTVEANTLTAHARTNYVDNPKIARTIDNIDKLTAELQRDSGPMIKDAREAVANLNRATKVIGGEEEQAKLKKAIDDVAQLAARANATAADAQSIVSHIKKGNGTVGALVMDEAVYDDVQEMVRDLKHNPWKFLWRE